MVGLPPADRVGAVELLKEDPPRRLVREGEVGPAPALPRPPPPGLGKGVGSAAGERHLASVSLPARRPLGEVGRAPLLTAPRQRDEARPLGHRRQDSRLVLHLPLLDPRVAPQPVEVLVTSRPERRILDAAHRDDAIAHQAYIPRSRCIAATRSTASM